MGAHIEHLSHNGRNDVNPSVAPEHTSCSVSAQADAERLLARRSVARLMLRVIKL